MKFNGIGTKYLLLPDRIEAYLATAASILKGQGDLVAARLLTECHAEGIPDYQDNLDSGQYYYRAELSVPADSLAEVAAAKSEVEEKITDTLEETISLPNEFVSSVSLVVDTLRKSVTHPQLSGEDISRIWGTGTFRLFFSHKSGHKANVAKIKEELSILGVSCFVAHEDIEPTKEWQNEIERALNSMDIMAALLTQDFHSGSWTDQEVGFAFGRGIPIIAVKLEGADPRGFIGKFQAVASDWVSAPQKIAKLLFSHSEMVDAYVEAMKNCSSFDNANKLAEMLPEIKDCSKTQVQGMLEAYNENTEISHAFGFNGTKTFHYGPGLAYHLEKVTGRKFRSDKFEISEV